MDDELMLSGVTHKTKNNEKNAALHVRACTEGRSMAKGRIFFIFALALSATSAMAQQKTIKIGFVSTFSGPPAAIGNDMRNSFELALDHMRRQMGGVPVE